MKIKVTLEDSYSLYDAIEQASLGESKKFDKMLKPQELKFLQNDRIEEYQKIAAKWFKPFEFGEYLTVEIDTDLETIRVIPLNEEE